MLIAGETSGDTLAAELVVALRRELLARETISTRDSQPLRTGLEPRFFGAGGPRMKAAGVELAFDLTQHSVIGISDVLKNYLKFRRLFHQLLELAIKRQPDVIIGIDYGGFNLRFGEAIRAHLRKQRSKFNNWNPKIVQFVSPQVWASRAGRAFVLERDYDLLLSIFPFEKGWYAKRVPKLRVEFVGHPMADRFEKLQIPGSKSQAEERNILLLPGSRRSELNRHLPVMLDALKEIQTKQPEVRGKMVLPNDQLAALARSLGAPANLEIQIGNLSQALSQATVAIASTGTVTMECAFFDVPTVTLYKTSWTTYQIAKRIVTVKSLTMPNLLADAEVFPEFIQNEATPENLSRAALELLQNPARRAQIQKQLRQIIASLGGPGATTRAAKAIAGLLDRRG
ncbi:MAG TPA: lipid-A-disaccharide synthase [Candidatus Paceibacterota bacterium]|nr:lipid-A-disaccharide synthase [Candidatus Paceibacterota bacterium]